MASEPRCPEVEAVSNQICGRCLNWQSDRIHCFLPSHRTDEDRELQKRGNVAGTGKADPETFRALVEEAGLDQCVIGPALL